MAETLLQDDAQTITRLDSVACLLAWMRSIPKSNRKQFSVALAEDDAVEEVVVTLLRVVKNPQTTPVERQRALKTISEALFLSPDDEDGQDLAASETNAAKVSSPASQETQFARRLRELMDAKQISQRELAERVGCSQPAISQMLNRQRRPQKKTILKLAEALNVQARDLWPDIDTVELLDAVASFQEDDYVMTDAEARALANTAKPNRPRVRVKPLPTRTPVSKDRE